ncbi:asparagine synthase-related protein, partial [Campylobacter fetus]|uniref:asparagine synthase-related protein n=1 Tax=Campylobacter fetus TaxID=196 RepID=UPI003D310ABA
FVSRQKMNEFSEDLMIDGIKLATQAILKGSNAYEEAFCNYKKETANLEINFGYTRYDLNYQRYKFYKKFSFLKHIFLNLPYPLLKKTFELNSKTLGIDKYYRIKDSFKTNKFMELYALEFKHFKNDEAKLLGILDEPKLSKFELKNSYESMSFSDISTYLSDDIFVKTDRAAMSVSLEVIFIYTYC